MAPSISALYSNFALPTINDVDESGDVSCQNLLLLQNLRFTGVILSLYLPYTEINNTVISNTNLQINVLVLEYCIIF